jgi:hypothetical protein
MMPRTDTQPPAPMSKAAPVEYSVFRELSGANVETYTAQWGALCKYISTAKEYPSKPACPLIKLATFGNVRTDKGSLRHDSNVLTITGIEGDYDAEEITPEDAITRLEAHQVRGLVYTSWSHTPQAPRWRVLAPLSQPVPPAERLRLAEALNGILGGILAPESATLSQSYYVGRRPGGEYRCLVTYEDPEDGWCLDVLDYLDTLRMPLNSPGRQTDTPTTGPARDALASLLAGDDVHASARTIVARMVREGVTDDTIRATFAALAREVADTRGEERAAALRGGELDRLIEGARSKGYAPDAPIPLDDHAPQAIPADTLPGWLGAMAGAVAQGTETPPALATMAGLACVAAAVQRKVRVRVEPGYIEPLALWTVCALDPGNRKTAVMGAMAAPLYTWERTRARELAPEIREAEALAEAHGERLKRLRSQYAKAKGDDLDSIRLELLDLEARTPEIPHPPRIVAQDVTPEHTGTLLAEHGERLALLSDEGGIFDILAGRYSRGVPNLDLFLQAHAGAPVRVDRGSRTPVHLAHPALTIGLSPQPEVLRGLASQPGFRGRGLLGRFLYTLPTSTLGYRTLSARPVPEAVSTAYADGLGHLLDMEPSSDPDGEPMPYLLELEPKAHAEWKDFQRMVEVAMREGGHLEHITDWGAKLPGAVARVAGLLHCVEHAHGEPWRAPVSLDTMTRALTLGALLIEHARAVFDLMGSDTAMGAARKVWRWIEREQQRTFKARDCWKALKGSFPRRADIDPALSILVERNHIMPWEPDRSGPGRPSLEYVVHPTLSESWT